MAAPTPSSDDLFLLLVLHYLQEREYYETARSLERETGIVFNIEYFGNQIVNGMFDDAEEYLEGFTQLSDNKYSARTIYLIKQLKLLEALHDGSRMYAQCIVENEFPQFNRIDKRILERANELLAVKDRNTHPMLRNFDKERTRKRVAEEVKKCIRENPVFRGKLVFPSFQTSVQRMDGVTNGTNGIVITLVPNRNRNGGTTN